MGIVENGNHLFREFDAAIRGRRCRAHMRTGQAQPPHDGQQFRTRICNDIAPLLACDTNLQIDVEAYTDFGGAASAPPRTRTAISSHAQQFPARHRLPGRAGAPFYTWHIMTPLHVAVAHQHDGWLSPADPPSARSATNRSRRGLQDAETGSRFLRARRTASPRSSSRCIAPVLVTMLLGTIEAHQHAGLQSEGAPSMASAPPTLSRRKSRSPAPTSPTISSARSIRSSIPIRRRPRIIITSIIQDPNNVNQRRHRRVEQCARTRRRARSVRQRHCAGRASSPPAAA